MPVRKVLRRVSRAIQLVRYDVSGGKRSGRVSIEFGVRFDPDMTLTLERGVWLDRRGMFRGGGRVSIGAESYLGAHFSIHCAGEIRIGRDCLFGDFVSIIDNNHGTAPGTPMRLQPLEVRPVRIGDDCWLGQGAIVLPGVTIGDGAVVAAGAVVRADVPPGAVVGGVPARLLRMRSV